MGSLFRSEEMSLCQFFIQTDSAYWCVSELGEMGVVQFRDLNPDISAFQRRFVSEVRRCDELERKSRFIRKAVLRYNQLNHVLIGDKHITILEPDQNLIGNPLDAPTTRELADIESQLERWESDIKEGDENMERLNKKFSDFIEMRHVLRKLQKFFEYSTEVPNFSSGVATLNTGTTSSLSLQIDALRLRQISFIAGVINYERVPYFERMLWRVCRGLVYLRYEELDTLVQDILTGQTVRKAAFVIFFQGEQFRTRITKICDGFHATTYPCPDDSSQRRQMMDDITKNLDELQAVIARSNEHRHHVLTEAARQLATWEVKLRKTKSIYHTLNLFGTTTGSYSMPASATASVSVGGGSGQNRQSSSVGGGKSKVSELQQEKTSGHTPTCLIGEGWCPTRDLAEIRAALQRGTIKSQSAVPSILNEVRTSRTPPTYYRLNKFTQGFQNLVDAYGISSYREVNPAPYTIITFPFLFAIMFGDAGHGAIMCFLGILFILMERPRFAPFFKTLALDLKSEMIGLLYGGRYTMLLMGIFSIYCGFVYNDFFSKSIRIFPSGWRIDRFTPAFVNASLDSKGDIGLDPLPNRDFSHAYPFGIDPMWMVAKNKISFANAIKMKLAVILGLAQMTFGLILSVINHRFFRRWIDIWCGFIPEMIFLMALIGYLIFLIFFKWVAFGAEGSHDSPSILIGLINMILFKYDETLPKYQQPIMFAGQKPLQMILVLIAVICIPWMLLVKPSILLYEMKKNAQSTGLTGHANALLGEARGEPSATGFSNPLAEPSLGNSRIDSAKGPHGAQAISIGPSDLANQMSTRYGSISSPSSSPNMREGARVLGRGASPLPTGPAISMQTAGAVSGTVAVTESNSLIAASGYSAVRTVDSSSLNSQTNLLPGEIIGSTPGADDEDEGEEHFEGAGDLYIHQAIHTIEFCLGCVSNTASYLRLWALSLAHTQLSEVLWNMVLKMFGLGSPSIFFAFTLTLGFTVFASLTLFILVIMEGLSAFLHALRLHWVEFQNKFYKGTGHSFVPFTFANILDTIGTSDSNDD